MRLSDRKTVKEIEKLAEEIQILKHPFYKKYQFWLTILPILAAITTIWFTTYSGVLDFKKIENRAEGLIVKLEVEKYQKDKAQIERQLDSLKGALEQLQAERDNLTQRNVVLENVAKKATQQLDKVSKLVSKLPMNYYILAEDGKPLTTDNDKFLVSEDDPVIKELRKETGILKNIFDLKVEDYLKRGQEKQINDAFLKLMSGDEYDIGIGLAFFQSNSQLSMTDNQLKQLLNYIQTPTFTGLMVYEKVMEYIVHLNNKVVDDFFSKKLLDGVADNFYWYRAIDHFISQRYNEKSLRLFEQAVVNEKVNKNKGELLRTMFASATNTNHLDWLMPLLNSKPMVNDVVSHLNEEELNFVYIYVRNNYLANKPRKDDYLDTYFFKTIKYTGKIPK